MLVPCILFIILWVQMKRNNLQKSKLKLKLGILYREYNLNSYFWEFIKIYKRILMILVLNFYSQQIRVKAMLVICILAIYSLFANYWKPYVAKSKNLVDLRSSSVCTTTIFFALFAYDDSYLYI